MSAPADQNPVFAPDGQLRAAFNVANTAIVHQNAAGALSGPAWEVASAVARRLNLPLAPIGYPSAGAVVASEAGAWDIALIAIDAARIDRFALTRPYRMIEAVAAVGPGKAASTIEDLDHAGCRIATAAGAAYDNALARRLTVAERVPFATSAEALDAFATGKVDAIVGIREVITHVARAIGGDLLPQPFHVVEQAVAYDRRLPADIAAAIEAAADPFGIVS